MRLSADEFWKALDRWKLKKLPIVVELVRSASPHRQERFMGTVLGTDGKLVIFLEAKTGKERPIDFADAEIFIGDFEFVEPFGMVRVFRSAKREIHLLFIRYPAAN
jgi:hypothetical protein